MTFKYTDQYNPMGISSAIYHIWYNHNLREMAVALGTNVYIYIDVPENVYDDFVNSNSLGTYYINHIKGQYSNFPCGLVTDFRTEPIKHEEPVDKQQAPKLHGERTYRFTIVVDGIEKTVSVDAMDERNAFDTLNELALTFNAKITVKKLEIEVVYG